MARGLISVTSRAFSPREVDEAVPYLTGVSPLRYATADGVADQAATQVLAGLPADYDDRSLALLRSVTPDSSTAAYQSVEHHDQLILVEVGDDDRIAERLRAAGFADLDVVSQS